jgi:ferredoxin
MALALGWIGARGSSLIAQFHPEVELAELYLRQQNAPSSQPLATVDALAYARAEHDAESLLARVVDIRRQYRHGGWAFGAFVGLLISAKLARFSIQTRQTDFEPDRGACVACARCFAYCPQERVRRGTWPAELPLPGAPNALGVPVPGQKESA